MMQRLGRAVLLLGLLGLTACSSFRREWTQAGRATPGGDPFSGAWEGRWQSASHRGPSGKPAAGRLRTVFTPEGGGRYRAHFHARWLIFSSSYVVHFTTQRRGGALHFRGGHDLGALFGGIYSYAGRATPSRFTASYDSRYDRGSFDLGRAGSNTVPSHTRH